MAKDQVNYNEYATKYKQMVKIRKNGEDIDITDYLPSIYDMLKEDCVWTVLDKVGKELNSNKNSKDNKEDVAYYTEKPPIMKPGYYEKENCFVLRSKGFKKYEDLDWKLGEIDGDTWEFDLEDLDSNGPFTIGDIEYSSYKDYAEKNSISCKTVKIRAAGIDAPEICHYTCVNAKDDNIIETTYKKAILKGYAIRPYKINRNGSDNPSKWTFEDYKNKDKLKFYGSGDSYCQIVDDVSPKKGYDTVIVANGALPWGKETLADGYKAQERIRDIMERSKVKEVITIVDRNIITGERINIDGKYLYFNSFFFNYKNIDTIIQDFKKGIKGDIFNFNLGNVDYAPFGCDKYGRLIGNSWALVATDEGDMWVDLSKYVMTGTKYTENNPEFYSPGMNEIYGGLSDGLKQWTNTSNEFRYVDSLSANGTKSYKEMLELHKSLTGIDFKVARDHTVLLGDALFIIPPEAIRTSTTLDYEKIPIIRGKGSMMKNKTNIEDLIELELYFNNEYGINGIPYKAKTPNGKEITYYMNGLRALVAQFRVCPFLPIHNHYINDVLNIETVSLVNMNISTVDGFPKLLKVVLTLRDFNYRIFMPDLPLPDYDYEAETISDMQPIFAQCIDWELFRYYYQKGILNGELLKGYDYNTSSYNNILFTNKNLYKHASLNDSNLEIYIPDVSWLKGALQLKKTKDKYGQTNTDFNAPPNNTGSDSNGNSIVAEMNGGVPYFSDSELKPRSRESYSKLDSLGRCGPAFAVIGRDLMPEEGTSAGDLSSITPSGWEQKSYPHIQSDRNQKGYLYNRSHLIGYQLTGQTTNAKNLITGTSYMNAGYDYETGMIVYENKVADYLKKNPDNHVAYRVTPIFDGNNLVASGVQMEAYSIEDDGKLQFNVYIQNVQPGVKIEYSTGKSEENDDIQMEELKKYNYKDPSKMKFVPYLQYEDGSSMPLELDAISFNMTNYFTETRLKAVDGYAPQYMGGSDVSIEAKMTITDEYFVGTLKALPHLIVDMIRNYRRVMPCFPLRVKNEYLQMIGVNEVVLDNVSVSTIPGFPGVFDVTLKFTSMDRTMRQREALEKANLENNKTSISAATTINNYFNLSESLAAAELYPDLDLPTIKELSDLGWKFAKWANDDRVYVDPDFYMCYSFHYASRLIKEIVNKIANEVSYNAGYKETMAVANGESTESTSVKTAKNECIQLNKMRLMDSTGMCPAVTAGIESNGLEVISKAEGIYDPLSDLYDNVVVGIQQNIDAENMKKRTGVKDKHSSDRTRIINAIYYLTATGIESGWQVVPGWFAPLCDTYVNDELEKLKYSGIVQEAQTNEEDNEFLLEIYDLRHRAIMLIDRILNKPLMMKKDVSDDEFECLSNFMTKLFADDDAKKLIDLLCPMSEKKNSYNSGGSKYEDSTMGKLSLKPKDYEIPDPYMWIQGMLYALACTRSGDENYTNTKKDASWQPHYFQDGKNKLPYVRVDSGNNAGANKLAKSEEEWKNNGVSFGAGQITRYTASQIKKMTQPESKITYFHKNYKSGAATYYNNMYWKTKKAGRKRYCETGFLDPYYNYAGYKSAEGKDFIERISTCKSANFEALFREVLVHLKRLIMDGYIFSEVDVIAQDWDSLFSEIKKDNYKQFKNTVNSSYMYRDIGPVYSTANDMYDDANNSGDTSDEFEISENLLEAIPEAYNKLFCARWIYPFALAATNCSAEMLKLLKERKYDTLSSYTLSANIGGTNDGLFTKFLSALFGVGMIGSCNVMDSAETTSNTQKAFNTLMSEAFTALSEDPRCYTLHMMYDMCVNDKRGRLLRAFPTYYMLFVDEGRTIGSWKLFDNFYNMSSISNLQVVKSRKMPADTCTFTMSNMFMSYTDTYDNTIYNQYVDVYGFADVFSSIFTPKAYLSKEDMIRQRKELTDTTAISPGVRLHVRMGYGSDGSRLPVVFNGKIAEVDCGDVVNIVAQGDGHELNNPLNTLGDLTARNFEESQSWFTLFKDIRGSLARGGETPRNLIAKIATAQYGGLLKTVTRNVTKGRFFYDNPFGLYHFGDRRFKDIFTQSEIVQNLYEVSNKTILNGTNDLLGDISTFKNAPIINCTIQDKTLWEIGHLCANSGDDYYFAVRDFGMRSTMCLCKANHYYAYEYQKAGSKDDKIAEKRKPFQQFHYYDSYNDIIYNALKASETNMKTNAVGTWEGSDPLWGTGQQSVGPIYLDINIYPEYQKSMMVETGLVAGGDGGINIPIVNYLSERFNMDEYAGQVNKSLAEKVTTNVLRQSIKDMYDGEICVIGDSSLKPYDRVTLMDVYEDMSGSVEVETVIHSMNIETGFTTTFVPDVIVRAESTSQEMGTVSVLSSVVMGIIGAVTYKAGSYYMALKGSSGLIKIGGKALVDIAKDYTKKKATNVVLKNFANAYLSSTTATTGWSGLLTFFTNPYALATMAIGAVAITAVIANWKESLIRTLRNLQALSVFPITKNGRQLIAGMAGHKGSVFGYPYSDNAKKNSVQYYVMSALSGTMDTGNVGFDFAANSVGWLFNNILIDENFDIVRDRWVANLGLEQSNDIIKNKRGASINQEAFYQALSDSISKEQYSRSNIIEGMKIAPRVKNFNTSGRTNEIYLKYQIGGVHDKSESELAKYGVDPEDCKAVSAEELSTNEKIKTLVPIEDDAEIKLALNSGDHPVIKQFNLVHSTAPSTFELMMENENTTIRYITEAGSGDTQIFDLPMIQEDALNIIKLIINRDEMKGKVVTFVSGTKVNSTQSWKSTGFAFSLSSDDFKALKGATEAVKKESSWIEGFDNKECFAFNYKATSTDKLKSIQYTVYAPLNLASNEKYKKSGE